MGYYADTLPDVRVLSGPCAEGLQLALGLAHPCVEEVELAEGFGLCFGVTVNWVESDVRFD
jgi:hypothetical protein